MTDRRSKPQGVLERYLGEKVEVTLKNGDLVQGKLKSFDTHINLKLEDACKPNNTDNVKFKRMIIRGSNVVFVSPSRV